jgi:hypothetical protein
MLVARFLLKLEAWFFIMLVCFGILNNQGRRFRLFPWHFSVCVAKARNKAEHKR